MVKGWLWNRYGCSSHKDKMASGWQLVKFCFITFPWVTFLTLDSILWIKFLSHGCFTCWIWLWSLENKQCSYKNENLSSYQIAEIVLTTYTTALDMSGEDSDTIGLWYRYSYIPLLSDSAWVLTHWGRDKMDAILQTTFWNAFSSMKMFEFQLKFHWNLFPRVQLTIFQHWFR